MSAEPTEDLVTIEVDGRSLQARKGAMLIDITDQAGIYIPRFCYHKKLTVAANCRMCLVEVERVPKPQPACATPVMDGMKVQTKSVKAVAAQQATMEFLLINHPLDCPICDQGGECELQDLALGYGSAVSQFTERKRVVRDKNIGPLVQTDMTRCIHCTRCVRFGEEVAGLRELGATGRGEDMEIGTYVAQAMVSELSGNVIDLCPVGALTSKPYRYSARAWELQQADSIAPHDCVGSNLHVHSKGQVVKRIVPQENEAVNETWISDRDRFSYQALKSDERLLVPRIKENGRWRDCDWDTAFVRLQAGLSAAGARIGALVSPSATNEEFLLLQRMLRGLGSNHIDHRLRQLDFSHPELDPVCPGLGFSFTELTQADAIVLVGGYPRHDQPLINHRIRQAAQRGAQIIVVDSLDQAYNFELAGRLTALPSKLPLALGGLLRACAEAKGRAEGANFVVAAAHRELATRLTTASRAIVLAGNRLQAHPARAVLLNQVAVLAEILGGRAGQLTEGANTAGAWVAGAVPHRGPGGRALAEAGMAADAMFDRALEAYLVWGVEPARDCAQGLAAHTALQAAKFVAVGTLFRSTALDEVADLMVPLAAFAENEGSTINVCGAWQEFTAAVKPPGEARAGWKILRALGERCNLPGFDAVICADLTRELRTLVGAVSPSAAVATPLFNFNLEDAAGLERVTQIPMYASDGLVRRAPALQQMPQCGDEYVHVSPATLVALQIADGAAVRVSAGDVSLKATVIADSQVLDGSCLIYGATALASQLPSTNVVHITRAGA